MKLRQFSGLLPCSTTTITYQNRQSVTSFDTFHCFVSGIPVTLFRKLEQCEGCLKLLSADAAFSDAPCRRDSNTLRARNRSSQCFGEVPRLR